MQGQADVSFLYSIGIRLRDEWVLEPRLSGLARALVSNGGCEGLREGAAATR